MSPQEIKDFIFEQIKTHIHDGNFSQRINFFDIFGYTEPLFIQSATVATTGNTDTYFIAPRAMTLVEAYFSGVEVLATSDTNYITWTVTNLGQVGTGTAALLKSDNLNTTKATGGAAIAANTKRTLIVSTTPVDVTVNQGDRIRIRAAVTNTLANTVTFPVYQLIFQV